MLKSFFNVACAVSRSWTIQTRSLTAHTPPLLFRQSPVCFAEPLKKKKRLDPAVVKAREDRRRRKLEKQIRRLEKNAKQLKPIEEIEVAYYLIDNQKLHERPRVTLTPEILEQRALLEKQWAAYKRLEFLRDMQMVDRIRQAQRRALDQLRAESEDLYNEAIQVDMSLIPYHSKGAYRTPPSKKYAPPDGEYVDITKKWD